MQQGAHFIGCDAGTTDSGPYYLGARSPRGPREGIKRNLRIMIREGLKAGVTDRPEQNPRVNAAELAFIAGSAGAELHPAPEQLAGKTGVP